MIAIGLGANLQSQFGPPEATISEALKRLDKYSIRLERVSSFYESAPVPVSDQPWYVNAAALISTVLTPRALLSALKTLEADFGRESAEKNAARIIDLDLLIYDTKRIQSTALAIPHPRMHERAFVLYPLNDVVGKDWRHPVFGLSVEEMISQLDEEQVIRPLERDAA